MTQPVMTPAATSALRDLCRGMCQEYDKAGLDIALDQQKAHLEMRECDGHGFWSPIQKPFFIKVSRSPQATNDSAKRIASFYETSWS